jgi:signal transduction histidine kinase
MKLRLGNPGLATRLTVITLGALLLATLGNFILTFSGPPPFPAPIPVDELLPVLAQGRHLPPNASTTRIERRLTAFAGQPGELRVEAAEPRLAARIGACDDCVRLTTVPSAMIVRRPQDAPLAIRESFSVGLRQPDGTWSVARYSNPPLITAWHWTTLAMTLAFASILGFIAWLLARSIIEPLRRLSAEADAVVGERDGMTVTKGGPPEVARLADAVMAMRDRLALLVESRTRMLAAIAHDMAAPLARLQFRIQSLPDEARDAAEADIADLSEMITGILNFARGNARLERQPVDLGETCRKVASGFTGGCIVLSGDIAGCIITGDALALRRLITNLASNAVRYAGGGEIVIESASDMVTCVVRDDGPGFPPEFAERLFEPFFRVETSRNRDTAGTGLGLANALETARAHAGTLTARNRSGGGAEFVLSLPRA